MAGVANPDVLGRATEMLSDMTDIPNHLRSPDRCVGRGVDDVGNVMPVTARQELRRDWAVLAAVLVASSVGPVTIIPFTAGVFLPLLEGEFGWTRGMTSLGIATFMGATAMMAPVAGTLADRYGARIMLPASLIATAGACFAMSRMSDSFVLYLTVLTLAGIFGAGASTLITSRVIASVFDSARGTALGIGLAGIGLASMFAPGLITQVTSVFGWRAGYQALFAILLVTLPLIAVPVWRRESSTMPAEVAPAIDRWRGLATILRQPLFLKLATAFFLIQVTIAGLAVHFIPMLRSYDLGAPEAALYAGLIGAVMITSRVAVGVMLDRFRGPQVAMVVTTISALGLAAVAVGGAHASAAGAIAVGLLLGAEFDLAAFLASRYFPSKIFGRVYGLLYTVMVIGTMASTQLYGVWYQVTGSYTGAVGTAALGLVVAVCVFSVMPRYGLGTPVERASDSDECLQRS